jgi:4-hydroxy-3-polyprenylbenzoate decarboxylase
VASSLNRGSRLKYGERDGQTVKQVIALTGCSGIVYGVRLLKHLQGEKALIISSTGKEILDYETGLSPKDLAKDADEYFEDNDLFAPLASGSHPFDAMIIAPCSESTLAKIACGIADTLITRTAAVALKEHRRLILVTRETPVSAIMLENELKLARLGVMILPASPGFYHRPRTMDDLVDFVVGKILDQVGQEHTLFERWKGQ